MLMTAPHVFHQDLPLHSHLRLLSDLLRVDIFSSNTLRMKRIYRHTSRSTASRNALIMSLQQAHIMEVTSLFSSWLPWNIRRKTTPLTHDKRYFIRRIPAYSKTHITYRKALYFPGPAGRHQERTVSTWRTLAIVALRGPTGCAAELPRSVCIAMSRSTGVKASGRRALHRSPDLKLLPSKPKS